MREILFRGKCKETNKWVISEGFLKYDDGTIILKEKDDNEVIFTLPIIPETLGQFTGLTDKNGNKIFEGDYIYVTYNYIGKQEVKYLNEKGRYNISNYALDKVEIIGNIHETNQ